MKDNESQLIRALKDGSYKAFDKIYEMYARRMYAYSLQFTKSAEDSKEIVQDVFLKLWINREKIKQEDTLRSLLFIMTKHAVITAFRTQMHQPVYEEYIQYKHEMSIEDTLYRLEYKEFIERFKKAMSTLPDTQQKVIRLAKMEQLSNKEIAEKLSLSEQTVKNQLSLGLKALKENLGKLWFLYLLLFIN